MESIEDKVHHWDLEQDCNGKVFIRIGGGLLSHYDVCTMMDSIEQNGKEEEK